MSYAIVVVEDHDLTRIGLRTTLEAVPDFRIVGEAEDGVSGLEVITRQRPDVAVIDLGLPGMDGIALTRRALFVVPELRVLILTMHDLESEVLAALAAGADAYALKNASPDMIVAAVRIAAEGGAYFDPQIAGVVLRHFGCQSERSADSPLTVRETEVLRMIAEGRGNSEIAEELALGLGTIKGHVRDILEKLAAADRAQAAVIALRRGLIS
jgi:two-component system, NarL family, response regulator LiaR